MYPPSNQLQAPPDDEEELENDDNCKSKNAAIKEPSQENILNFYHHQIGHTPDLSSQKSKAKKRKAEIIELHAAGRKDRHSKVFTASGPRDRRVRLSPETAIQFYDVQDRLGYDRPSKAIDWLITEAKAAIEWLDDQLAIRNYFSQNPVNLFECGMDIQKHEYLNEENRVSGFSNFIVDGAGDSCFTEFQGDYDLISPSENLTWNYANEYSSQMFYQREPLQSSNFNYSPISSNFPGFNFSNEVSEITAAVTLKEDEKVKKPTEGNREKLDEFLE
ncbi:hypothetical protein DH2020_009007 [Rehmannia glutinosa]|uniref:TCP domain-containing protein n=1 Tax=Rehmannia glutinosa TaxID=99300 RepID=A0ABR0X8D3_REHGL